MKRKIEEEIEIIKPKKKAKKIIDFKIKNP